jgi:glutamine synthetase
MSDGLINCKTIPEFLKVLKDNDIQYVDFLFTDMRGKLQHTAQHIDTIDKEFLEDGVMFDGSSIAGWKAINESDMILKPDVTKACFDPFAAQPTVKIFCDVFEPSTGKNYDRDPRSPGIIATSLFFVKSVKDKRRIDSLIN